MNAHASSGESSYGSTTCRFAASQRLGLPLKSRSKCGIVTCQATLIALQLKQLPKVEVVCNAEIGKRSQAMLVNGIPEPELSGYASVEPFTDRQAITPFGCCG